MIPSRSPIYIAGQTGSGKTAVSVALASHLGESEILSADAFQVYEGMEILSAAPTPEEQGGVHHHFVSCRSPALGWDAATFADEARNQLADLAARAPTATPIVVGGSGLYLKALTHGLAPTPKGDPALRAELDALSLEQLVERYRDIDPDGAAETNLKNRRYVTRNLEISLLSGEPASALKQRWRDNAPDLTAFYLHREREDIYERIDRRTHAMFSAGVVAEVAALGDLSETAEKAIGLAEIRSLLAGEIDEATCIANIQQATRRYAKRQASWFRRETAFEVIAVGSADSPTDIVGKILARLDHWP